MPQELYALPFVNGREARMRRLILADVAACAAVLALAAAGRCDHLRHARWQRSSRGWRAARAAGLLRRHLGDLLRDADLTEGLPHRRALRSGRQPGRGHVRLLLQRRRRGRLLGHLARRPGYNQAQSDPQDVAVVVLDKPVTGITPARLPEGRLAGRPQRRDSGSPRSATAPSR